MFNVKSVDEVFRIIDREFSNYALESETVDIRDAVGRVTFEDVTSFEDIPGFNRSSVDGYAVSASDTFGASDSIPAQLKLCGEVKMGEKVDGNILKGQTVYVPTGGEIPQGADSVVMIEYTDNYDDGFIYVNKSLAPGANVVFKGDDMKNGSAVIARNHVIRPQDTGVFAALGIKNVKVKRKVRVGIISTGDEVVDIDSIPVGSQVRDINSYTLYSSVCSDGAIPNLYGIIKDDSEEISGVVQKAMEENDVVLISGGSSVGTKDETYKVIDSLGNPGILVHGIAVKPGKPTILGKVNGKAIFGLPGHPASAFMIYRVFVSYLINVINGKKTGINRSVKAQFSCNYPSNNGREEFIPVRLEVSNERTVAIPVFGKSGLISLLSSAQGFVHKARCSEGISAACLVEVVLF